MSIENHGEIFFPTVQLVQLHWNPIAAVMVSMLVSSVVECRFESRKTKVGIIISLNVTYSHHDITEIVFI